jgi:hypothetical protein
MEGAVVDEDVMVCVVPDCLSKRPFKFGPAIYKHGYITKYKSVSM